MLATAAMVPHLADLEQLTERVIGCAIAVHRVLGPGLLESVYSECLALELLANGLQVERERHVPIIYREQTIRSRLKVDLLVEDRIIVEVKAVERSHPVFVAQLVTYLKLTGMPAGLLLNFNACTLKAGLKRASHPDVHALKMNRGSEANGRVARMDIDSYRTDHREKKHSEGG